MHELSFDERFFSSDNSGDENCFERKIMNKVAVMLIDNILTPKQKEVYVLFVIEKKTGGEIAEELGISANAVYRRYQLAKRKIQKCTMTYFDGEQYVRQLRYKLMTEISCMSKENAEIVKKFYLDGVPAKDIVPGKTAYCIGKRLEYMRKKLRKHGLGAYELKLIRRYCKQNG